MRPTRADFGWYWLWCKVWRQNARIMNASTSRRALTTENQSPLPGTAIEIELASAYVPVRSDFDTDALRDVVRIQRGSLMRRM